MSTWNPPFRQKLSSVFPAYLNQFYDFGSLAKLPTGESGEGKPPVCALGKGSFRLFPPPILIRFATSSPSTHASRPRNTASRLRPLFCFTGSEVGSGDYSPSDRLESSWIRVAVGEVRARTGRVGDDGVFRLAVQGQPNHLVRDVHGANAIIVALDLEVEVVV